MNSDRKTYLAIGAHIGDMDLTAGPLLAAATMAGHRAIMVALTPGERGHPRIPPREYKQQKLAEGQAFAAELGAEFRCLDWSDGYLPANDEVFAKVASIVRETKPDMIIAHWKKSIHTDHENASVIAQRARFYAALPTDRAGVQRHSTTNFLFAENWEDAEGFRPSLFIPIPDKAFALWDKAIYGQAFARGETYGFRYIDYYSAQMTMRGCLAGTTRALAFASSESGPRTLDLF